MDSCRKHRDEAADRFFRRIHVTHILPSFGGGMRIDYMRTPRGYSADSEWLVPGTFDLSA